MSSINPKIIAMYLPQFHEILENNEFWGKGFTDWVTVKRATPLFKGHRQPSIPLNHNYYDLSKTQNVEWQCELAHKYGIYAFAVYHYWFNDTKNLLTTPAEIMRDSKKIETKYFLTWDNCSWIRSWSNVAGNDWAPTADENANPHGPQVLIKYELGEEQSWLNHYNYINTHFRSDNYLKIDNKPVFAIIGYRSGGLDLMYEYWNELAKKDGFDGIHIIYKYNPYVKYPDYACLYNYEPHLSAWGITSFARRIKNSIKIRLKIEKSIYKYDYDKVWADAIKNALKHDDPRFYHGAFVGYDDSPRRGLKHSRIILGKTPEKFEKYLSELIKISKEQGKDFIFLTAWNEWGEGAFLEPDEHNAYSYLTALSKALNHVSIK